MSLANLAGALTDQIAYIAGSANAAATLTLAAEARKRHAIVGLQIYRTATAALGGTASLTITTTNLPTVSFVVGNLMVAGGTQIDVDVVFNPPLVSAVKGTATTFVMPQPGAAVLWNARAFYYLIPEA